MDIIIYFKIKNKKKISSGSDYSENTANSAKPAFLVVSDTEVTMKDSLPEAPISRWWEAMEQGYM